MSKEDLSRFLKKVEQLRELVDSLDRFPNRKKELESCKTHEEVIDLTKEWGFDIGKRWGEQA